jgi:RNA polymerase sigma-70 factor, ECF subfamily
VTHSLAEPEPVVDSRHDDWRTLYEKYSVDVWRYVANIIGSDADAVGDAVQETFMAAARAFDQFDPARGTARAWLIGIAHREVAKHWRRVARNRVDSSGPPVEETSTADSVTLRLEQEETVELVCCVLSELPADSAALLTGKYCEECTVAELVEQFGGTVESVRSKLARARREFKTKYERASGGVVPWGSLQNLSEHDESASRQVK